MKKSEFLYELENCLGKMKAEERKTFITYYEEIIEDYKEEGLSEEESVRKVGSPSHIANEILADADTITIKMPIASKNRTFNIILLILGFPLWGMLLLSAILCVISAYMVMWCVPFAAGVGTVSFLVMSLVSIIASPVVMIGSFGAGVAQLGLGIASIGISVLLGFATVYTTKQFAAVTKNFTLKMIDVIKKGVLNQ